MTALRQPDATAVSDRLLYPESDGQPMGETPRHRDEMAELIFRLRQHFQDDPAAYVSGNMMVYYEVGNPAAVFSPDAFVALGAGDGPRRVFKLWEEPAGLTVVFEVSSRTTSLQHEGNKKVLCERLGVREYWLYDPEAEALDPPLQGFRLASDRFGPILPKSSGRLPSRALGLELALEDGLLELFGSETGRRLLRTTELAAAHEAAEREVDRLRAELDEMRRSRGLDAIDRAGEDPVV